MISPPFSLTGEGGGGGGGARSYACENYYALNHSLWVQVTLDRYVKFAVTPHPATLLKKVSDFPVPSRDVTTQTLPGGE
jgi:hypothetical protein